MIEGLNYIISKDGTSIRLWKIRGTKLSNGLWKIEEWKYTESNHPDSCPPDRVADIEPQPAHALLDQLYDRSIAAQIDDCSGSFYVTPRTGVYLFLEGFLTPEHFKVAAEETDELGGISVSAPIRSGRHQNEIHICHPICNLKGEVSLQGAEQFFVLDKDGWLSE